MALTKQDKIKLASQYQSHFDEAKNIVIIRQIGVPVNEMNYIRKDLIDKNATYKVVKKRVLIKSLQGTKLEAIALESLEGSVAMMCAYDDEFAPLKVVHQHNTSYKKAKLEFGFEYVGGRFDGKRQDGSYVMELATISSKEELLSKLLYLIKYPIQSLAVALNEVAKKGA